MNELKLAREILLSELDLEGISPAAQEEAIDAIMGNVVRAVLLAALEKLPSDAQGEFKRLSAEGTPEQVEALLKAHISDFDGFVDTETRKEIALFKETLAAQML